MRKTKIIRIYAPTEKEARTKIKKNFNDKKKLTIDQISPTSYSIYIVEYSYDIDD